MRTRQRPMRSIGQTFETAELIAAQPLVHRLARHPELLGNDGHLETVDLHSHHCLIALLHFAELHKHSAHPLRSQPRAEDDEDEVSSISRYRVNHQPISRHVSAGTDLSSISRAKTPPESPRRESNP